MKHRFPDVKLCPYGQVGDALWVRETWQQITPSGRHGQWHTVDTPCDGLPHRKLYYAADAERDEPPKWRPSIFMPRWASRITLEITGIRVERLQAITDADIAAEGFGTGGTARITFAETWEKLNGKKFPWASDPWVWRIEFKRIEP